jgi:hypothetical protein
MSSRNFKDDDGPTMPESRYQGAPSAPLDLVTEAPVVKPPLDGAVTAPVRPPVGKAAVARPVRAEGVDTDELWNFYESALRAWGKMTVTGAPRDAEHAVVNGAGELRAYLQSLDDVKSEDEQRRIAILAVQLKAAIDGYETWLAERAK